MKISLTEFAEIFSSEPQKKEGLSDKLSTLLLTKLFEELGKKDEKKEEKKKDGLEKFITKEQLTWLFFFGTPLMATITWAYLTTSVIDTVERLQHIHP